MFLFNYSLFSRDNYVPMDHRPLTILVEEDYILYAKRNLLLKYKLTTQEVDTINNELLPRQILTLASNKSKIYAGDVSYYYNKNNKTWEKDSGLFIFDKSSKLWERCSNFDDFIIRKIIVNEQYLLLATDKGVIKVDLNLTNQIIYNKSDGLESDNVYSLFQLNDTTVFIGIFRYGIGTHQERKDDMFGLGLNKINLKNHKITKIKFPKTEIPYYDKFLVLDMYPNI